MLHFPKIILQVLDFKGVSCPHFMTIDQNLLRKLGQPCCMICVKRLRQWLTIECIIRLIYTNKPKNSPFVHNLSQEIICRHHFSLPQSKMTLQRSLIVALLGQLPSQNTSHSFCNKTKQDLFIYFTLVSALSTFLVHNNIQNSHFLSRIPPNMAYAFC